MKIILVFHGDMTRTNGNVFRLAGTEACLGVIAQLATLILVPPCQ